VSPVLTLLARTRTVVAPARRMPPNNSFELTTNGRLRRPPVAVQVSRWRPMNSEPQQTTRYRAATLAFVLAILGFVGVLQFTAETAYRELGIVVAAICWAIAAIVGVLTIPRRLWRVLGQYVGRGR
jgi:hypothetical protein